MNWFSRHFIMVLYLVNCADTGQSRRGSSTENRQYEKSDVDRKKFVISQQLNEYFDDLEENVIKKSESLNIQDPSAVHSYLHCNRGTCAGRCWQSYKNHDPEHEMTIGQSDTSAICQCDDLCIIYGDCCFDFFLLCHNIIISKLVLNVTSISELISSFMKDQSYLHLKTLFFLIKSCDMTDNYLKISTCPDTHPSDITVTKCKDVSLDPLSRVPVSFKPIPGIVFSNVFCGMCNGIPREELLHWNASASCETNSVPSNYDELLEKLSSGVCRIISTPPTGEFSPRKCNHDSAYIKGNMSEFILANSYVYKVFIGINSYRNPHTMYKKVTSVDSFACVASETMKYQNIEMPICGETSCLGQCLFDNAENSGKCRCDVECLLYGDCCYDFVSTCLERKFDLLSLVHNVTVVHLLEFEFAMYKEKMIRKNKSKISWIERNIALKMKYLLHKTCVKLENDGVKGDLTWVIGACPNAFPDVTVVAMCEQSNSTLSDAVSFIPASHMLYTDVIFRNKYCGLCHGLAEEDMFQWNVTISCPYIGSDADLNILFRRGQCKTILNDDVKSRECLESDMIPSTSQKKDDSPNHLKYLTLNLTWCDVYRYEIISETEQFRNIHCIVNIDKNVSCSTELKSRSSQQTHPARDFTGGLSVLFSFTDYGITFQTQTGNVVKPSRSCKADEVYDYFYRTCRRLTCLRGRKAVNGTCISTGTSFAENIHYLFPNGFPLFFVTIIFATNDFQERNLSYMLSQGINSFLENIMLKHLSVVAIDMINTTSDRTLNIPTTVNHMLRISFQNIGSVTENLNTFSYLDEAVNEMMSENRIQQPKLFVSNYDDTLNTYCGYGTRMTLHNVTLAKLDNEVYANSSDVLYHLEKTPFTITFENSAVVLINVIVCDIPLDCNPVTYNLSDFVPDEDRLRNRENHMVLPYGTYFVSGERIYSCHNFTQSATPTHQFFTFDPIQEILTYAMSGISIVSLIVTLLVYILLTELRNLPGRLIMSLSMSLILAQGLLLLISVPTGVLCQILAVLLHFFWLCSFMWMAVMSFNLAHTFSAQAKQLSGVTLVRTHANYGLCALGIPFLIVTTSVIVDVISIPGIYIGYGTHDVCWITNDRAALIVFGVPVAVILLVNTTGFIFTFYNIEKSMRISKNISSTKKEKAKFFIYSKLFIIMGLSWGFSFVATFAEIPALWYVFIILNGLQGFYIFVSFICTDRVYRLLKKQLFSSESKESKTPTYITNG